jgi:2-polyprenyl-3-methyl-5-hydroxy-6-metoxy-1,4-benzoquinol methylase
MSYKKVKEKNLRYFDALLQESADEHYVVAQSEISHRKRFEKLLELGDFNHKTVLDVGCGIGGFWDFLREKKIDCKSYTGIDINPHMIETAQKKHPSLKKHFFLFDILEDQLEQSFDYVIANGPLNLQFEPAMNMQMTLDMMRQMFHLAATGMAITMTSSLTRKPAAGTFYYDPAEIVKGTAAFCSNLRLDHTYLPHDFAIFCYKKDLYGF